MNTIFQDLPMILHLQDWYAAIGMIYTVVTGKRLFVRTAKTLLKLKASIKDHPQKKRKALGSIGGGQPDLLEGSVYGI